MPELRSILTLVGSVAGNIAVCPGFRSAHQDAVVHAQNDLSPAEGACVQINSEIMSFPDQSPCDVVVKAAFHGDRSIPHPLPAGRVQGLLGIHVEVDHIHDDLYMSLGLHIAAHYCLSSENLE